jgi:hypothetical protein
MWRVVPWLLVVGGQVQGSRLCVQDEGCPFDLENLGMRSLVEKYFIKL